MSVLLSKQPETFEGYIQVDIMRPVKKRWCRRFCRQRPVACCIARKLGCLCFSLRHDIDFTDAAAQAHNRSRYCA
jgi:hypothetical protein